ncbi:T9SS type A sorting domain-containing protein [Gaetbulibacter sp. M235]|uniref:T9SS type A sorting domain-containing protein n=1 Tax=Gaetbulibacter sp. M235 TaxID=3126510 RepID=UPI00374F03B3
MKKITCILLFTISLFSFAQEQHIYTFDNSEESFVGEGGTVTASPTGHVTFTSTTSSYARMAQLLKNVDANTYKFLHIRIKNLSADNDVLALAVGPTSSIVVNIPISVNDADYKDYTVELTSPKWIGTITPFKFFPKSTANGNLSTAGTIIYDYIIFSSNATLAVNDVEQHKSKIYPNPAKDVLNIKTVKNDVRKLELYNLLGKKVASKVNSNNINVQNLSKGIYLVQITTDGGVLTSKFLKD